MGKLGVVAFVDSLAVLKDWRMWRQDLTDVNVPVRPSTFKLEGESEYDGAFAVVCLRYLFLV